MSQTLTTLAALSSPVKPTDNNTLVAGMSALDNLGRADLLTVTILGMVYALVGSGTDYTANHPQLIQDSVVFTGGVSMFDSNGLSKQVLLAIAVVSWGTASGISSDVATLLKEGRDLRVLPEETLTRIFIFLFYSLAV